MTRGFQNSPYFWILLKSEGAIALQNIAYFLWDTLYSVHSGSGHDFRMQVESFISIFSAPFGQIWKISVPIIKRISRIFRNTPYLWSLCHFEGSYSQSKINFRATSFATGDCMYPLHSSQFPVLITRVNNIIINSRGPHQGCLSILCSDWSRDKDSGSLIGQPYFYRYSPTSAVFSYHC